MDYFTRSEKIIFLSDSLLRKKLKNNYSSNYNHFLDCYKEVYSSRLSRTPEIIFMDMACQLSGVVLSETTLAQVYSSIYSFFLGTTYQDDILDSLNMENPKSLITKLGIPSSMAFSNVLYLEGIISLLETNKELAIINIQDIIQIYRYLIQNIMETELFRRNNIGQILNLDQFYEIWSSLSPYPTCVDIGGLLGNSEPEKLSILKNIASKLSIINRIAKDLSEIYGLRGSLIEILKNKPPSLPILLCHEKANSKDKSELKDIIMRLISFNSNKTKKDVILNEIEKFSSLMIKYDSMNYSLNIYEKNISELLNLIAKFPGSNNQKVLASFINKRFKTKNLNID